MADYQFEQYQGPEKDFGLADVPDAAPRASHHPQERAVLDYTCGGGDHPYCEGFVSGDKRQAIHAAKCGLGPNPHRCGDDDEKEGMHASSTGGGSWLNRPVPLKTIILVLVIVYVVMVACEMRAELRALKMGRKGYAIASE